MKTLLVSASLFALTHGVYVMRTFADAATYKDECVEQYHAKGNSLIDYMRQVYRDNDADDDSHWCVIRCILLKSGLLLLDGAVDAFQVDNIHEQMQQSNAIVEDPEDIRSETDRCLRESDRVWDTCLRAYTFFSCIQSTEYDLF
ncbi:uncharacterized protein LOC131291358 [Anopheles ziemanni]|uniref:uncharacterized protein LOC131269545 n=1 Tax=Anopheles coustani TaxID=139045 RepID=UPI00265A3077|nr:uncharacterized protein LOC131269545 [Anopheles coustani]XP_058176542.1 uncharacterized protein LOC131291358 [Anopheles ziemanni]